MAIDNTYKKILLESFLNENMKLGTSLSADTLANKAIKLLSTLDLTKPLFISDRFKVEEFSSSSASQLNIAQNTILQDLKALYQEMFELTETSTRSFERWRLEAQTLEKEIAQLEDRIDSLLLLTQDTEGYHSFIVDNFDNFSLVDTTLTTVRVDPVSSHIIMANNNTTNTRIFLNNLDSSTDISFKVRSTNEFISRNDNGTADKEKKISTLANIFKQEASSWWTEILMKKAVPVTCELVVKLDESPLKLNRIFIVLNEASKTSAVTITPLYSIDNFTFKQLPTNTYTQDVRSTGTFSFEEIEAKYIKFLLTKNSPDPVDNRKGSEVGYQFGFSEISFYREGFTIEESQQFFSTPLSIADATNTTEKVEFSKLTLDACERVEKDTEINYFVTPSDDSTVPISDTTIWVPITPINRVSGAHPKIIFLDNIEDIDLGITEDVKISFTGRTSEGIVLNPANSFNLLSLDDNGVVLDEEITTSSARYIFTNSNERILNYQIKDSDYSGSGTGNALTIDEDNITMFRNIGTRLLDAEDENSLVRGVQRGWKFEEPYYSTVIEISNPVGLTIDFGDQPIYIDDQKYSNVVSANILTGKTQLSTGIHKIKVHKNNWLAITPSLELLEDIKAEDSLYPYNHKLLIEGYSYPTNYIGVEKKYIGANLFASELMKQISVFELMNSVGKDQWRFYALDRDAPDTHTGGNESTRVFVLKVDESKTDFKNEHFVLRLKLINQRYKYLRLRADFRTNNEKVSPSLDSYKIKLG